jgi:hypothetical protein
MGKTIKINPADIAWVNEQLGDFESHLENSDQIVLPIDLEDLLNGVNNLRTIKKPQTKLKKEWISWKKSSNH